jgi:hypothetical protein
MNCFERADLPAAGRIVPPPDVADPGRGRTRWAPAWGEEGSSGGSWNSRTSVRPSLFVPGLKWSTGWSTALCTHDRFGPRVGPPLGPRLTGTVCDTHAAKEQPT